VSTLLKDKGAQPLLNRVKVCLKRGRDAYIEAGDLLLRYLIEHLKKGDFLPEGERRRLKLTRREGIKNAAEGLDISKEMVQALIRTAGVVVILGPPGPLTYGAVRYFQRFVRRRRGRGLVYRNAGGTPEEGKLLPSQAERYELTDEKVRPLYERAIKESMDIQEVRQLLVDEGVGAVRKVSPRRPPEQQYPTAVTIARQACPRDLVDMLCLMISQSQNPNQVAEDLLRRIPRLNTGSSGPRRNAI
jgi:hypothetical protein